MRYTHRTASRRQDAAGEHCRCAYPPTLQALLHDAAVRSHCAMVARLHRCAVLLGLDWFGVNSSYQLDGLRREPPADHLRFARLINAANGFGCDRAFLRMVLDYAPSSPTTMRAGGLPRFVDAHTVAPTRHGTKAFATYLRGFGSRGLLPAYAALLRARAPLSTLRFTHDSSPLRPPTTALRITRAYLLPSERICLRCAAGRCLPYQVGLLFALPFPRQLPTFAHGLGSPAIFAPLSGSLCRAHASLLRCAVDCNMRRAAPHCLHALPPPQHGLPDTRFRTSWFSSSWFSSRLVYYAPPRPLVQQFSPSSTATPTTFWFAAFMVASRHGSAACWFGSTGSWFT